MTIAFLMFMLVALGGSAILMAAFGWTFLRIRRLENHGPGQGDPHHLLERMDALKDELAGMQDEFTRITERVDFTERLLERPPPPDTEAEKG